MTINLTIVVTLSGVSALSVLILAIRHLMTMRKPDHVVSADPLRLNDDPLKAGHGDPLSR
jgi:hypothetical protein